MNRREISRSEWPEFVESFTGAHEGWLVGVDRFEEMMDEEVMRTHHDGALRGIQVTATEGAIELALDDRNTGHLATETISAPQRIVLEQADQDVDTALEIDGPQSCLILRFRSPMPTDMVDGMA